MAKLMGHPKECKDVYGSSQVYDVDKLFDIYFKSSLKFYWVSKPNKKHHIPARSNASYHIFDSLFFLTFLYLLPVLLCLKVGSIE